MIDMETIYGKFIKNFHGLKLDYLPRSYIPRLRILFDNHNAEARKKSKDLILSTLFGENKVFTLIMFWSGSSKKIKKNQLENIKKLGMSVFCEKSKENIVEKLESNLFGHIFLNKISKNEFFFLSDIKINDERGDILNDLPFSNSLIYFFDKDMKHIVNVYSFEGVDICSYDKKYLYHLRDLFKEKFEVLDDKIDL